MFSIGIARTHLRSLMIRDWHGQLSALLSQSWHPICTRKFNNTGCTVKNIIWKRATWTGSHVVHWENLMENKLRSNLDLHSSLTQLLLRRYWCGDGHLGLLVSFCRLCVCLEWPLDYSCQFQLCHLITFGCINTWLVLLPCPVLYIYIYSLIHLAATIDRWWTILTFAKVANLPEFSMEMTSVPFANGELSPCLREYAQLTFYSRLQFESKVLSPRRSQLVQF